MRTPELDFFEKLRGASTVKPTAPSEGSAREKEMVKSEPDFTTPLTLRNLFTHHDAHPVVLHFALLKAFGVEWLGWEAETIYAEIQRVFQTQVSELTRAKIQTVKTLQVSNLPWESWNVFEKIIQGLNNNVPRFDVMQAPSLEQLYAGIDIMEELRQEDFSDEVKLYMSAAVLHEDVFFVPPPLDFVQLEVSQPHYRCKDCGSEDSALFHDGICDTCTSRFEAGSLSFQPDPEALAAGKGKNTELILRYNPDDTQALWEQYKSLPTAKVDPPETAAGVQVAKLLVARDYMNIRRRQLAEQLTALKPWLGAA